jgi:ketosteroid isomerase-like protein
VVLMPEPAVLEANLAFYEAIASRDLEAMAQLWSSGPVTCIHPGWPVLHGREAVMASWQTVLSGPNTPSIRCGEARVVLLDQVAVVTCLEQWDASRLAVTNLFTLEDGLWKIVHHHAGPCEPAAEPLAVRPPPHVIN